MFDRLESETRIEGSVSAENEAVGSADLAPDDGVSVEQLVRDISPETKMLISRCIDGTEPLDRPLKTNEAQKLSPKAVQAVMLRASGFKGAEIAKLMDMDQVRVSVACNHPYGKKIITKMLQEQGGRVLDLKTKLEDYANKMVDRMVGLALTEPDLGLVQKVTFGLLDRSGHGPQQKVESSTTESKTLVQNLPMLERLDAALRQSQSVNRVTAHYKQVPPPLDAPIPGGAASRDIDSAVSETEAPRSAMVPPAGLQFPRNGTNG